MLQVPGILLHAAMSNSETPGSPPFFQGFQEGGWNDRGAPGDFTDEEWQKSARYF